MEVQRIPKRTVSVIEPQKSILVDKEKYHQKRVAAYCRVSTDSEEQLTSYQNQMRVYTEMIAARKEWEFAGLYADEGISGTRADKRPEFQRMIRDCQNGKIDYIITKSVSRFARNTVECLEYVRSLKAQGIGIFFEEQNIDTLKNESELYLVIYAGFAQSESESISKHITWTYRKNFEDGKVSFQYKRLLGYRKGEDGKPEIVPEEAAIVERIFEMLLAGQPVGLIAQTLQSENIEIPGKDLSFSKNMIMNILRNEKYCGDSILQKTVTVDCISKTRKANHGEAPMYLVENSHPAIISRDIFHRTQEELARRKALRPKSDKTSITQSGKYSKYALSEVLHCAECGRQACDMEYPRKEENRLALRQPIGLRKEILQGFRHSGGSRPAWGRCPGAEPLSRGGRVHLPHAYESHHRRSHRHKWRFRGNRPADTPHRHAEQTDAGSCQRNRCGWERRRKQRG